MTAPPAAGLTPAEVAQRVADGRANDLPSRTTRSVADIVRANVFTRINAILAVLFAIVLATGSLINGLFGLLIIVNSVVGMVQELRAKQTLDKLSIVGQAKPLVRRADGTRELPPNEVVSDDIIELGPGDQIVVDGKVIEGAGLEVDESLLTGEADPVLKPIDDMVMSGSFVVTGTGAYRATKVGHEAYVAKLTAEASFIEDLGADSLDIVELVMEFEKEFNIDIPDEDAEKLRTVGDAIKYLDSKIGA